MRTIRQVIIDASPRRDLCNRLAISVQLASDMALGERVGGARTLVRIADQLGLDDSELGASVRELVAVAEKRATATATEAA